MCNNQPKLLSNDRPKSSRLLRTGLVSATDLNMYDNMLLLMVDQVGTGCAQQRAAKTDRLPAIVYVLQQ